MTSAGKLSDLELSAFLCSKVCHDVINPVGALMNGLEVLNDDKDDSMREMALDLIAKSARQASARLQYARMAFGAAGSAGATLDLGEIEEIARGYLALSKIAVQWDTPGGSAPRDTVKLLLNLIAIGIATIPGGGTIAVSIKNSDVAVKCSGEGAKIPDGVPALVKGEIDPGTMDARSVQAYYAGRVAEAAGLAVRFDGGGGDVVITAVPLAAAA